MKILVLVALLQRPGFPVNQAGLNIFCYYNTVLIIYSYFNLSNFTLMLTCLERNLKKVFLAFSFKPLRKIQIRSQTFQIQA